MRAAGDCIAAKAVVPCMRLDLKPRVHHRSGAIGKLQRLFVRVQRHERDPEQALQEAEEFLGADAGESPEFV